MHCEPNWRAPSAIISGFRTASELTLTFSAPARSTRRMSSSVSIPPPTAKGIWTAFATSRTMSISIPRLSADAVMS